MPRSAPPTTPDPSALLLRQFLAWVADRPRGYAETMAAWRTSCPRLQVWEDATAEGLVRLESGVGATPRGSRRSSRQPSRASSPCSRRLSGGCRMPSRSAARVTCPSSATATKARKR